MCTRRAGGAGKGRSVSVPSGSAPESVCVVCSSCLLGGWVQASGAAAFPPRHSSWLCLCSACALPAPHQGNILSCWMEAPAGRQQRPGGSSSALLGPVLQTGPRALLTAMRHHLSPAWKWLPQSLWWFGKSGELCGLAGSSRMSPGKADLGERKLWVGKWWCKEIITCPRLLPWLPPIRILMSQERGKLKKDLLTQTFPKGFSHEE